jgi:hypothetical protein
MTSIEIGMPRLASRTKSCLAVLAGYGFEEFRQHELWDVIVIVSRVLPGALPSQSDV